MGEGPNLVANGDFPSNISSWNTTIAGNQTGSIVWYSPGDSIEIIPAWTFVPPMMFIPGAAWADQQITGLSPSTDYIMGCEVDSSSGTPRGEVGLSDGNLISPFFNWLVQTPATTGTKSLPYTTGPSETSLYVMLFSDSAGPTTPTTRIDDVTLKEQNVFDFVAKIMFY